MMGRTAFIAVLLAAVCGGGEVRGERFCGLDRMARIDALPELLPGTKVMQVSSHDRLGGNDGDGYFGTHPALYQDTNGEYVLFEEKRPGCLNRFWMTFSWASITTNRMRFYFDGELTPRLDVTVGEFFSGTNSPFLTPLVGNAATSCKGYYSYYPFEFEQGLKVTISSVPSTTSPYAASSFYYNMTWHQFDSADGVTTWTGTENEAAVLDQMNHLGTDPKSTNGNVSVSGRLTLGPGESGPLLDLAGQGAVQSIQLDPSPATTDVLQSCLLQMNWDGGDPEVSVPLGSFFGSSTREMEMMSLLVGMRTNGNYYCFFPMPFWTSAGISISNPSDEAVEIPFEIQYTTDAYEASRSGLFSTVYKDQTVGNDGQDVNFADVQGRGHCVGLSLFITGFDFTGNNLDHLEGDERIYFDGSSSPTIYGTGTEDYFNCAWYFQNAPCLLPYHGCVLQEFNPAPPNNTQAYRFHISDVLPFNNRFHFDMEHGRKNDTSGRYVSVVYLYQQPAAGAVLTADFQVTQAETFSYEADGGMQVVSNVWCFEGDDDQVRVAAEGVSFAGQSEFIVPVATNAGVVLRRLTDRGVGRQQAVVSVDGVSAGIWYDPDCNFLTARKYNTTTYLTVTQRWNEAEFLIPPALTAGKTNLHIRIQRDADGADSWNEYSYQVFCIVPLDHPDDVDQDGMPDRWEVEFFNNAGAAVAGQDDDEDGQDNQAEYIAGTSPVDSASVFAFESVADTGRFFALSDRTYDVLFATNLFGNSWVSVTNFTGVNGVVTLPLNGLQGFYRARVWKNP